jgi:hypothetical protein
LNRKPDDFTALVIKAKSHLALSQESLATKSLEEALALFPQEGSLWLLLGQLREEKQQYEKAREAFDQASRQKETYLEGSASAMRLELILHDYQGVITRATERIKRHPKELDSYRFRARAHEALGQQSLAEEDARKVLAQEPEDGAMRALLAPKAKRPILLRPQDASKARGLASRPDPAQPQALQPNPASTQSSTSSPPLTAKKGPKTPIAPQGDGSVESLMPLPDASAETKVLPDLDYPMNDPCAALPVKTEPNPRGVQGSSAGRSGVTLAPSRELCDLAEGQYNGMISMAQEGMRLVYGRMSPEEEAHFQKTWAAMHDFPSESCLAYLERLLPLLGQFLSGREAYLRMVASFQTLQFELALAVAAESQEGYEAVMESAVALSEEMTSIHGGLETTLAEIEALGPPPDPRREKCQAAQAYRKRLPQKERMPLRGLEGEWVGYLDHLDEEHPSPRQPLQWVFKYHLDKNPFLEEPMESLWGASFAYIGAANATLLHWNQEMVDHLDGDTIAYEYESEGKSYRLFLQRVDGSLPDPFPQADQAEVDRLIALDQSLRDQFYSKNKIQWFKETPSSGSSGDEVVRDVAQPSEDGEAPVVEDSGPKTEQRGGVTYYHDTNAFYAKELDLGLKLTELTRLKDNLTQYLQRRHLFHQVAQQWLEEPPEEIYDADKRVKQFNQLMAIREGEWVAKQQEEARLAQGAPVEVDLEQQRQDAQAAELERQGIKESIDFHVSMVALLKRQLAREQQELQQEQDPQRRKELAFRIIQIQSNIQAEQDLADSYKTGQLVHRRSAFDEYAHQKFVHSIKERVARIDAVRRMKRSIERQIALLPEDQRGDLREITQRILDPQTQAIGDVAKARRLVVAVNHRVQGYWENEGAMQESRIAELDEQEFYLQTAMMTAGGLSVGLGSAAMAASYGETAALAVWAPQWLGGIYGGITGYIVGGPEEALKQSIGGTSPYAALCVQFVDSWLKEGKNANATWKTQLWKATQDAGLAFLTNKAVEFSANFVVKSGLHFFGPDSVLFKPLVGKASQSAGQLMDAARTQQAVDDAMQFMNVFKEKQLALAKLRTQLPAGSPQLTALDKELSRMAASINSSYHGKWLMKYKAHPSVRKMFNSKVQQHYDEMMPEMMTLLAQKGYDVDGLSFKPIRNASSAGTSSMDLDLALVERPGLQLRKNGQAVSLHEFQRDAQQAMNVAYHQKTGYSAVRSEMNFTTSVHDEAFSNLKLLKGKVKFSEIDAKDIASVGKVIEVKVGKIEGDPVLTNVAKMQSKCRESSKEIENMLIKRLEQQLAEAPAGSPSHQQTQADLRYWQDMLKRFKEMGSQETNPYRLMELERTIRMETGGKGSQEVIQDLIQSFQR